MKKTFRKLQLIPLLLLSLHTNTFATTQNAPVFPFKLDSWIYIGGHPLNYLIYANTNGLKREGNIISVWAMRTQYANTQHTLIPSIKGLSSKSYENIDCENIRIRWETLTIYSDIMGRGTPTENYTTPINWQRIVPSTDAEIFYNFFCDKNGAWWK